MGPTRIETLRRHAGLVGGWLLLVATLSTLGPGLVSAQQPVAPSETESGVTLNLKDADIEAVIATVSEMTGRNFIVDPRVKGKITVISAGPMDADTLYQTFLAVLDVHGFAAVEDEGVTRILPAINARQSAGLVGDGGDSAAGNEYVTQVIRVNSVNPLELVPILRPLLPQEGHLAAVEKSRSLIASGTRSNIRRLQEIIARIDRSDDDQLELIRLTHASATEVVRLLQSLVGSRPNEADPISLAADERTNSILLSGRGSQRLRLRTVIAHLDTPLEQGGSVEVIYLNYADAREMVRILTGVSRGLQPSQDAAKPAGRTGEEVYIEADESSNSLIINAPPEMLRSLRGVVQKLDFRRAQIHVEAVIAEVTSETARELGVQWLFRDADVESAAGAINFSGSGSGIIDIAAAVEGGALPVVNGLTLGLGDLSGSVLNIAAVIRALAADAQNNILSTPSLMTMDNQEAEIGVGKEVPFLTGSYTSTGSGSSPTNPFQTYERKNVGLSLKVRPQINEGDAVRLEITQEVSSLANSTQGAADLVTNKRTLRTTVMVNDGQTIVLGGLIDEALRDSEQKVPLLGDIPVLGQLFRYDRAEKVKTNLMIFLRPTILRDAAQAARMAGGKYQYMRAQQLLTNQRDPGLMQAIEAPVMQDWEASTPLPTDAVESPDQPVPEPGEPPPASAPPFIPPPPPQPSPMDSHLPDFMLDD